MSSKQLDNVNFEIIRYANCWEDADILLKGLAPLKNGKIISIASAGDNCFSLLTTHPDTVFAVDISATQLHLVELKKIAISNFDYDDYLSFVGFSNSNQRIQHYNKIKSQLSDQALSYWNNNLGGIEEGVIHIGKFERYFQLFKKEYLHQVHDQKIVDELFREKSESEQKKFHDEIWHNEDWKKLYSFYFGAQMMGDHGRDPAFLKYVKGSVPDIILAREVEHLRTVHCQKNYFLYYILNNQFNENFLPHYVRKENYELIKKNINSLQLVNGLLDEVLNNHNDCNYFNLSDIFEYMDDELFMQVASSIIDKAAPKAKIAYWNLMIPRKISAILPHLLNQKVDWNSNPAIIDNGYFYKEFIVDEKV